uniref:histone acetyltransferase n=1 Tax=Caenorhabditis tropicalis TaxID=1561998 RepID=A0A1I7TLA5_9PELO
MINLSNPSAIEPEIRQRVQQHLVFVIHSHTCLKRDQENANRISSGQPPRHPPCHLEHCDTFKQLLRHMFECRLGPICSTKYCSSSRKIMKHWKECRDVECVVCAPIRAAQT